MLRLTYIKTSNLNITVKDLDFAELYIIRIIQNKHFSANINAIKTNRLQKLNYFIDDDVISVGGG